MDPRPECGQLNARKCRVEDVHRHDPWRTKARYTKGRTDASLDRLLETQVVEELGFVDIQRFKLREADFLSPEVFF